MIKAVLAMTVWWSGGLSAPQDMTMQLTSTPNGTTHPPIAIIKYENQVNLNQNPGTYKWAYEAANGIRAQEEGVLKDDGEKGQILVAKGSFSFVTPEGQEIKLEYTADENGFNAVGSHLPTPPPVPPEIRAALEKNAADEAAGIFDDGKYRADSSGQYVRDDSGRYSAQEKEEHARPLRDPSDVKGAASPSVTKKPAVGGTTKRQTLQTSAVPDKLKPPSATSRPPATTKATTDGSVISNSKNPSTSRDSAKPIEKPPPAIGGDKAAYSDGKKIEKESADNSSAQSEWSLDCYVYVGDEVYLRTTDDCVDELMSSLAVRPGPPYSLAVDRRFGRRIHRQNPPPRPYNIFFSAPTQYY